MPLRSPRRYNGSVQTRYRPRIGAPVDTITLDGSSLTRKQLVAVARHGAKVALCQTQLQAVQRAADFLAEKVSCGEPTYGVTTGFGSNADKLLGGHRLRDELAAAEREPGSPDPDVPSLLEELQHNLIITHAVCVGKPFAPEVVRAMLVIRINTLMRGHSGIRVSHAAGAGRPAQRRRGAGGAGERLGRRQRRPGAAVASGDRAAGWRRGVLRGRAHARCRGAGARRPAADPAVVQGRPGAQQRHRADAGHRRAGAGQRWSTCWTPPTWPRR